MNKKLEIACFNKTSALIAQNAGADRIELSIQYAVGGISPPEKMIKEVLEEIKIPVHVLIRPRAGNFRYSEEELELMRNQIKFCRMNKVQAVVFGILDQKNEIDINRCEELLLQAKPMRTVFHRAFDACDNSEEALGQLIKLGFDAVLTSGGTTDALTGLENLKRWQKQFGQYISIIAGGGIRSSNLQQITETNCQVYHSSAITDDSEIASEIEINKIKTLLAS